ncbi:MAG: RNA-guided pseudouridylation complex pseudouridine synthase subunit Cbf5 [Sulfolobales archaeon]
MVGRGYPKVSGVLPVTLGFGTKAVGMLMLADKEYVAIMQLHGGISSGRLGEVLEEFTGEIYQKPPVKASVKRALRVKKIYSIKVLEFKHPYVLMVVGCEHGTYIRKLIHDIGEVLGVGAHMRELRRTKTGPFREDDKLITMHELSEAVYIYKELGDETQLMKYILPIEYAVSHMPKIMISDGAVDALANGADLAIPGIVKLHNNIGKGEKVAILSLKGELVAIGKALMTSKEMMEVEKGYAVKNLRVVIQPGTYPRMWGKHKPKHI